MPITRPAMPATPTTTAMIRLASTRGRSRSQRNGRPQSISGIAYQSSQLFVNRPVAGEVSATFQKVALLDARDHATRFRDDQRARRDVPRRERQLPEAVEPAARDVAEVERRRTRAADARRRLQHARELLLVFG